MAAKRAPDVRQLACVALDDRDGGKARTHRLREMRVNFDGRDPVGFLKPRAISACVTTPVPGPSSRTGPSRDGSASAAMARASLALDGATAPIWVGFAAAGEENAPDRRAGSRLGVPEVFYFGEKAFAFRLAARGARLLESAKDVFLLLGELDRVSTATST